jgi:hypothetical protein
VDDDLERRAGKPPEDEHPPMAGDETNPDPSDYADPRVAQPGDEPPDDRLKKVEPDAG